VASARRSVAVSDSGSPPQRRGARQLMSAFCLLLDRKPQNRSVQILCSPTLAYALTRSVSSAEGADVLRAKGQGTTSQPSHGYPHHSIELGFDRRFRALWGCTSGTAPIVRSAHISMERPVSYWPFARRNLHSRQRASAWWLGMLYTRCRIADGVWN
jgi:hypothetical protein